MSTAQVLLTFTAIVCISMSLTMPFLIGSFSKEAERMFILVKSERLDVREIGLIERAAVWISKKAQMLRRFRGLSENPAHLNQLWNAGLRTRRSVDLFLMARLASLIGFTTFGFMLFHSVGTALAGGTLGWFAPRCWLALKQRRRKGTISRSLPDMIDLLTICIDAGLGLDQALLRVADDLDLSHPEIAEELGRLTLERQAGASRAEAWQTLATRLQVADLTEFSSMLAEADRFGTPISQSLSRFSEELRTKRRQRAEEAAAKAKVKIIFPLVLCIFPCTFLVILGPAMLTLAKSLTTLSR